MVGGSQAGLAMGWHLARQGLRFVVLEAGPEVGNTWRSRWDSLTLFTPAQYDALPGMPFPAPADTYPTKDPVADYLQTYARAFELPVRRNARATDLSRTEQGFEVQTADEAFHTRQVVVATGPFQVPYVPAPAAGLDASVAQVHSAAYRNPQALPDGPVLVVGGGNSGFQIAEELAATRQVDLSVGAKNAMLPQRLAGRDLFWWLTRLGLMRVSAGSGLGQRVQARGEFVIGSSRRRLQRSGVRFRPRLVDAQGARCGSPTAAPWRSAWWCGRPAFDPTTRGSTFPAWWTTAASRTAAASPRFQGCTSWVCRGSTPRGSALLGFVGDDAAYLADHITQQHATIAARAGTTRRPPR